MPRFFWVVPVLLLAVLGGGGGLALLGDSSADAQTEGSETRMVALTEGWNLAGWTGPTMPFADAIADILAVTLAAAAFDAAPQTFRTWNATAPLFLNTLNTLQQGEALWVQVTAPIDWVQPVVANPGPLTLHGGFNLVTWAGPSGLEPAETFAAIETTLNAAFAYDKATETFASFGPARPPFLNDLPPVIYGDGFWALLDAPATWTQPSTSPVDEPANDWRTVSSLDGGFSAEFPGPPHQESEQLPTEAGVTDIERWHLERQHDSYQVSVWNLPEVEGLDAESLLDATVAGLLEGLGVSATSIESITLAGAPGRDFSARLSDLGNREFRIQLFLVGSRMYQVGTVADGAPTKKT